MKKIIYIVLLLFFCISCSKSETDVLELEGDIQPTKSSAISTPILTVTRGPLIDPVCSPPTMYKGRDGDIEVILSQPAEEIIEIRFQFFYKKPTETYYRIATIFLENTMHIFPGETRGYLSLCSAPALLIPEIGKYTDVVYYSLKFNATHINDIPIENYDGHTIVQHLNFISVWNSQFAGGWIDPFL